MLDLFRTHGSGDSSEKQTSRPDGLAMALEERVLFDASAVAAVAQVLDQPHGDGADDAPAPDAGTDANHDSQDVAEALKDHAVPGMYDDGEKVESGDSGTALLVVDTSVAGWQDLIKDADPSAELVLVDGGEDGISAITDALQGSDDVSSIHIVSHGDEGELFLGSSTIDATALSQRAEEVASWSASLTGGADILLYSCSTGAGDAGAELVGTLADLTGADVAASDDDTGSTDHGGDWDLEVNTGQIEAVSPLSAQSTGEYHGLLNDAPDLTMGATTDYTEGDGTIALNGGLTLTDADGNISEVVVQVTGNYQSGADVLSFSDVHNITGAWDASSGTLTLSGTDTADHYQEALRSITYENTSDDPTEGSRTVTYTVTDVNPADDPDGPQADAETLTFHVTAADDAPTVAHAIDDVTVNEDATDTTIDLSNIFTDIDNDDLAITKAVLSNSNESLVTATISGNTLTLDYADNQSGTATITVQATSNGQTFTDTFTVTVNPVNDAPELAATPAGLAYTEGDGAVAVDSGLTLADVDDDIASATVQITGNYDNGNDVLAFVDTGSITGSWDASTGTLTLTGTASAADYQAALRSVTFENGSDDPSGSTRSVTFTVTDENGESASNGAQSDTATRDISFTAVDDAPTVSSSIGDVTVDEDATDTTIDLSGVFSDADNDDTAITKVVLSNDNEGLVTATITGDTLTLDYADNQYGTAQVTIQATSNGVTVTDTFTVTVNAVNDAPVLGGGTALTPIAEDTPSATNTGDSVADLCQTLANDGHLSDIDDGASAGLAITGADTSHGTWQFSTDGGTTWSDMGALSDSNALLLAATAQNMVRFLPDDNYNGPSGLTVRAWDQTSGSSGSTAIVSTDATSAFSADTASLSITVNAVNDAPVSEQAATFPSITEDPATNAGTLVSDLLAGNAQDDADSNTTLGLAVTGVDTTSVNGTWQYSTDGTNWTAFPDDLAGDKALLLSHDTLVRFVPDAEENGTTELTYRVWDETLGALGDRTDVSTNGDATPFSSAEETATLAVTPVNDDPEVTHHSMTFTENHTSVQSVKIYNTNLLYSEVSSDQEQTPDQLVYEITGLPTSGRVELFYGGEWVELGVGSLFSQLQVNNELVRYSYTGGELDANSSDSFTFTLRDGAGSRLENQTFSVTILEDNDAVTLTDTDATVEEYLDLGDSSTVNIGVSDGDSANDAIIFTISDLSTLQYGHLEYTTDGNTWHTVTTGLTMTKTALNAGYLRYVHDGTEPTGAAASTTFSVDVTDGEGSTLTDQTITLNITGRNDAPTLSNGGLTLDEGDAVVIGPYSGSVTYDDAVDSGDVTTELEATDPDSDYEQITYTITSNVTHGQLKLYNGSQWILLGTGSTFQQSDIDNGYLVYANDGEGGGTDSFDFEVRDGDGAMLSDTFNITVNEVNDAPVIETSVGTWVHIGSRSRLSVNRLYGSDEESPASDLTYTWTGMDANLDITIFDGDSTYTPATSFTQAQLDAGVVYVQDNSSVVRNSTITLTLTDGGINGDVSTVLTDTATFTIHVTDGGTGSNSAPYLDANEGITVAEDNSQSVHVPITQEMLSSRDYDGTDGPAQLTYTIGNDVTHGTLYLNGVALGVGSTFTQQNINDGAVTYVNDGSENTSDSFTFTLADDDGAAGYDRDGGTSSPFTFDITITPVNDAPTLQTNDDVTVAEQEADGSDPLQDATPLDLSDDDSAVLLTLDAIGGTNSNLNWADVDNDDPEQLVFQITDPPDGGSLYKWDGSRWVALGLGGTFSVQDVTDGEVAYFHDADNESATDSFAVVLTDGGGTPSGEVTVNVNVTEVNDAPTVTGGEFALNEGETYTINTDSHTDMSASDPVGDEYSVEYYTITDLPDSGTLTYDGTLLTAGNMATVQITDLSKLVYEHDGSETFSDEFLFTATDAGGVVSESAATVNIDIRPQNDDPALSATTTDTVDEGGSIALNTATVLAATDPDNTATQVQFRITQNSTHGYLFLDANSNGVLDTNEKVLGKDSVFTQDDLDNGRLIYQHDGSEPVSGSDADSFSYTVSDSGSGVEPSGTHSFSINATNDAPEITSPATALVNEDSNVTIRTISLTDADVGQTPGGDLELTLEVGHGSLSFVNTSGLDLVDGNGSDGDLTVRGTLAELNAALAAGVTYAPGANFNALRDTESLVLTVSDLGNTGDGGAQTDTATVAITVNPVNDAPEMTYGGLDFDGQTVTASTTEDVSVKVGTIAISDLDIDYPETQGSDDGMVQVTLSVEHGTLTLDDTSGLTFTDGDGDADTAMTFYGAVADVNAALANTGSTGLLFLGDQDFNGTATITVTTSDMGNEGAGGALTTTGTIEVTVNADNDAPVLDNTTDLTLGAIAEDVTNADNTGTTVADILGSTVSDVDSGAAEGIAITGVDNTNGTWQYNTGSGWANVPTDAADSKAVLLESDDLVRFVPNANYNGTDTGSITIRAWDTSGGSAGPDHNITATGGTTAFSTDTDTVSVAVNAVNDAPAISDMGGTVSYTEGSGGGTSGTPVILDSDATIGDLDIDGDFTDSTTDNYAGATITVQRQGGAVASDVFGVSTSGSISQSGNDLIIGATTVATMGQSGGQTVITFTANATAADVDTVLQSVTYASTADGQTGTITVEFTFDDGNAAQNVGAQGTGGAKTATGTVDVAFTTTNDAPELTDGGSLDDIAEDVANGSNTGTTVADILGSATGSDPDGGGLTGMAVTAVDGTNGTWEYTTDGTNWNEISTALSGGNALHLAADTDNAIRFLPDADFNGTTPDITYRAWDGSNAVADGASATIAGTGGTTAYSDGEHDASITVTEVNDGPDLTNNAATVDATGVAENAPVTIGSSGSPALVVYDLDLDGAHATQNTGGDPDLQVTLTASAGTITLTTLPAGLAFVSDTHNGESTIVIQGTVSELNDALGSFQYTAGDDPNTSETINVTLSDQGNVGGGALTDASTITINNISPSNDEPELTAPASASVNEDSTLDFGTDIQVSDVDARTGEVTVTLSVDLGTLTLSTTDGLSGDTDGTDSTLSFSGTPGKVNAALTNLTFTPAADSNVTTEGTVNLNVTVNDQGYGEGGAQGSAETDSATIPITINPVNDAPVINDLQGDSVVFLEDSGWVLAGEATSVSDIEFTQSEVVDFNSGSLTVSITNGGLAGDELSVIDNGNITVSGNQISYSGTVIATFNTDADNTTGLTITFNDSGVTPDMATAVVNAVAYRSTSDDPSNAGANGTRTLTWTLNDGDGTALGGDATSAPVTTEVTFTLVNDAPVASGSPSLTLGEDPSTNNGGIVNNLFSAGYSDVDSDAFAGVAIVGNTANAATEGEWQYHNGSTWVPVGAVSESSALLVASDGNLRFVPVQDYNGNPPDLVVRLVDDSHGALTSGSTANITASGTGGTTQYSTDTVNLSVTVNAVNDQPAFQDLDNTPTYVEDGAGVVLDGDATIFEVDIHQSEDNYAGATLTLARHGGADAEDVFGASGTVSALTEGGNLVVSGTTVGTVTTNSGGQLVLTFNADASEADVNTVLQSITYANTSEDPPTGITLDATFSDGNAAVNAGDQGTGGELSTTGQINVAMTQVNDAPILTDGGTLTGTTEDTTSPGTTVADIISGSTGSDPDGGGLTGLAITGMDSAHGTWEYTIDGTNWQAIDLSGGALHLAADANNAIRFEPSADYNGSATITYRAWDGSNSVADGATSVISGTGGTTAYSTNTETMSLAVSPVNDQPAFQNLDNIPTYVENGPGVVLDSDASIFDVDIHQNEDNYAGATLTLARHGGADAEDVFDATGTVSTLTEGGNLVVSGTTVGTVTTNSGGQLVLTFNASATEADVNTVLQSITYASTADAPPANATLDVTFSDGNADVNAGDQGTGGELAATGQIVVTITPVDDAPELNAPTVLQNTARGVPFVFSSGNGNAITVSDVDAGGSGLTVTITADEGTLTLPGGAGLADGNPADKVLTITGTAAQINTALDGLQYDDAGNEGDINLTIVVSDNGNTGVDPGTIGRPNTGTLSDETDTGTVTIRVNDPVDDPPVVTVPDDQNMYCNGELDVDGISVADPDAFEGDVDVTVSVDQGTLTLNDASSITFPTGDTATGASITFRGTLAEVNAALDSLSYTPPAGYQGEATITVHADDLGNTGTGGPLTDTETILVRVNPEPENTPPTPEPDPEPDPDPDPDPEPEPEPAPAPSPTPTPPTSFLPTVPSGDGGGDGGGDGDGGSGGGSGFTLGTSLSNQSLSGHFSSSGSHGYFSGSTVGALTLELSDQTMRTDQPTEFTIPANAIRHNDLTIDVDVQATLPDGSPLPEWVVFDAKSRTFVVNPPANHPDKVEILVTARDENGNEAQSTFVLELVDGTRQAGDDENPDDKAQTELDNLHTDGASLLDPDDPDALLPVGKPGVAEQAAMAGRGGLLRQADELARLFANG